MENDENSDKEVDESRALVNHQQQQKMDEDRPANLRRSVREYDLKEWALVEQQMNCDVIQEMKELWEIVAKSAHESRFDNSNVMRVPEMGDTILFYQQRSLEARPMLWRSEVVNYPPKCNHGLRKAMISGIAIIEAKKEGMAGEATVTDGGIGASFVEIKLQSKWFKGYSFTIIIIGKYTDEEDYYKKYNDDTLDSPE